MLEKKPNSNALAARCFPLMTLRHDVIITPFKQPIILLLIFSSGEGKSEILMKTKINKPVSITSLLSGNKSSHSESNSRHEMKLRVYAIKEIEKMIEAEEIDIDLEPAAAITAMVNGAVFDYGSGGTQGYGKYRCTFAIRITAEVNRRRLKIGRERNITAQVGTVLLAHNQSGLISRYEPAYDSSLSAAKGLCEKLNALAEHVRCDGRYIRLQSGGFGLVVSRQGLAVVVRVKGRLHVLKGGILKPLTYSGKVGTNTTNPLG